MIDVITKNTLAGIRRVLPVLLMLVVAASSVQALQAPSFLNCYGPGTGVAGPGGLNLGGNGGLFGGGPNPGGYAGTFGTFTNFQGLISIAILIMVVMFGILSVAYAIGAAFQIQNLTNFAKQEMLEQVFNAAVIAIILVGIQSMAPFLTFFANLGITGTNYVSSTPVPAFAGNTQSSTIFIDLCNAVNHNIIGPAFTNWFFLVIDLFWVNIFNSFTVNLMPNGLGVSAAPYGGLMLLVQLIWDDQSTYMGAMFFGIFLVVLLFFIYYLFPLFLYLGLALRSFPWTRAAGGSLMAMFIAFYIIFPGLLFPFVYIVNGQGSATSAGLCNGSQYASNPFCQPPTFAIESLKVVFAQAFQLSFAQSYYNDVKAFVDGMIQVGLSIFGLVIALLIAYESVEKIGTILGAPSASAQRVLSRVL